MSRLRLVLSAIAIIASCEASGIGHFAPAVKSIPVVRYAPFYSFPNGVRSIHAVLPAVASPPAPVFRAFAPAPVLPAPVAAPVLPAPPPLFPRVYQAPAFPAPVFRTQFLPAPIPAPLPPPAPVFAPASAPVYPALPRFAPNPSYSVGPIFTGAVPFSPIVRAVAPAVLPAPAPAYPAPVYAPAPIGFARSVAYPAPAPFLPAHIKYEQAWK
ncbi:leucine-rich repeat extensin-like protein 3 [Maniola jurtina]|uniref:leucine-rich repeat extensin-like protein 3 n=1 Tax=Maniola jurtina TaxID=191418 RepID=UPI001E68F169|nr:leucine-rich repeat extensin-like protein 3 [Maniola jurtina]